MFECVSCPDCTGYRLLSICLCVCHVCCGRAWVVTLCGLAGLFPVFRGLSEFVCDYFGGGPVAARRSH